MPIEQALRRPGVDLSSAEWIVLGDGQRWAFPGATIGVRPIFKIGKCVGTHPFVTFGPDVDGLVDAMAGLTDPTALIVGAATIAGILLRRNYDLTDEDLDGLLCFRASDPESRRWIEDVARHVAGGE